MFTYHLRLAIKSLRRNPVVTALMIGAIALGVGVCVTTLTVYRLSSSNPIEHRNDVLYSVTLDNWDPVRPWRVERPELPPAELTYRDAMALYESSIPERKAMMRKADFVIDPIHTEGVRPFLLEGRLTTKDFFAMFDVPFEFGGGWDGTADAQAQRVAVLSKQANEKAFGGRDSVGETVRLDGYDFKVVGVLKEWMPIPKFYDLNNGALDEIEGVFVPYSLGAALELQSGGNVNCWGDERIETFKDFLASSCVWIQFWAELHGGQVEAFQNFIDNYAREQMALGQYQRPLNNHLRKPDEWLEVNEVVRDDNRVLVGFSFMFLAVCLLNMIGPLLAKFIGAAPLVGLRRALGASRGEIFRQHLVEVAVIGLGGGALGVAVGALGLFGVRRMYENYDALTRLDLSMGLAALLIAVLSGIVAGLYPTWRVCKVQPAVYLKTQ